jgi:glutamyl-tRNA reductase
MVRMSSSIEPSAVPEGTPIGPPDRGREAHGTTAATVVGLGISHKTAPVELRERLAFSRKQKGGLLEALVGDGPIAEAVVLVTCNRTELYLSAADGPTAASNALKTLADHSAVPTRTLEGSTYVLTGPEAVRHLFRVAAGLDSMVIGEAEIQGQLRRSFEQAQGCGAVDRLLTECFGGALRAGRRIRSTTSVGARPLSIPSVAAGLIGERLGGLAGRKVAVIGAGETGELAARTLAERGAKVVIVATRTRRRAKALAEHLDLRTVLVDELAETLTEVDAALSATASPHALIEPDALAEVMAARNGRRLVLIDLAVPRDVDPRCREIANVDLADVDDLQTIAATNRSLREADAAAAELVIDDECGRLLAHLDSAGTAAAVATLHRHADQLATAVLATNAGRWESLSDADRRRVEAMVYSLVKRLLDAPTRQIRTDGELEPDRVLRLFGIVAPPLDGDGKVAELPQQGRPPAPSAPGPGWPLPGGLLDRLGKTPVEIETRSRALAADSTTRWSWPDAELAGSCVYAAGDPELAAAFSIEGEPARLGAEAIRAGAGVLVDTSMARAGATRIRNPVAVAVQMDRAAELAKRAKTTRAAAGVRLAWEKFGRGGIVVVGNAPTALLAALDLAEAHGPPACLIATCPGFTLAAESKQILGESGLPHFAVTGTRGGTGLAVAVLNAIGRLAAQDP